jgi:hypothetical protein
MNIRIIEKMFWMEHHVKHKFKRESRRSFFYRISYKLFLTVP